MNFYLRIMMIAVAMVTAIPSFAVTDKEMEQARTIAAKHYLRYANNGSDYLDKISPASMAELSKELKQKEQQNLKSFNAVAVPKDYASWDKKKLVEYWSSTFFKSPGLMEDGKKCLSILAKNLNKINVSAPAAPAAAPDAPAKSDNPSTSPEPAQAAAQAPAESTPAAPSVAEDIATPELQDAVAQAEADAGMGDDQPRNSSHTFWYVAILVILVGVVIWLVMYASKSMREAGIAPDAGASEKEVREAKKAAKEEQNKMREQYAASLSAKNDEIKQLKSQCAGLESQLEGLRKELDAARRELSSRQQSQPRPVSSRPQGIPAATPAAPAPAKAQYSAQSKTTALPPVVYLGYVNQRGLFVKASRSLNVDSSVFCMDIPDGHHGEYRVANAPEILDRLLADPKLWLMGGCVIENPEDADIATEIVTLETGEAVFADNICRVVKKARIKFI